MKNITKSLTNNPDIIIWAFDFAKKFYDEKTYQHAMRVAGYVSQNYAIPDVLVSDCVALAIMHDLLEDTNFEINDTRLCSDEYSQFVIALKFLTKEKDESYREYCELLSSNSCTNPARLCAYFVKLADMKDHLNLKSTLTDKLKNKYLEGLAILL